MRSVLILGLELESKQACLFQLAYTQVLSTINKYEEIKRKKLCKNW